MIFAAKSWSGKYDVGVKKIDDQHHQFMILLNDLYEAMRDGKERVILNEILEGLTRYVTEHFTTEERFFELYQYPETNEHKKEHEEMKGELAELARDAEQTQS